jgi:hypothetical protein
MHWIRQGMRADCMQSPVCKATTALEAFSSQAAICDA